MTIVNLCLVPSESPNFRFSNIVVYEQRPIKQLIKTLSLQKGPLASLVHDSVHKKITLLFRLIELIRDFNLVNIVLP